jgi:hypothetical protein
MMLHQRTNRWLLRLGEWLRGRRPRRRRVKIRVMRDCLCACEPAGPRPPRIRCTSGVAWVTQAGNPADVILRGRETFTPARRGTVVVRAIENCTLTVAF